MPSYRSLTSSLWLPRVCQLPMLAVCFLGDALGKGVSQHDDKYGRAIIGLYRAVLLHFFLEAVQSLTGLIVSC